MSEEFQQSEDSSDSKTLACHDDNNPHEVNAGVVERFRTCFPNVDNEGAIDLMIQLLHFLPDKRISAEKALEHRYLGQFHDPSVERRAAQPVRPDICDDDKKSTAFYRERLYDKVNRARR